MVGSKIPQHCKQWVGRAFLHLLREPRRRLLLLLLLLLLLRRLANSVHLRLLHLILRLYRPTNGSGRRLVGHHYLGHCSLLHRRCATDLAAWTVYGQRAPRCRCLVDLRHRLLRLPRHLQ